MTLASRLAEYTSLTPALNFPIWFALANEMLVNVAQTGLKYAYVFGLVLMCSSDPPWGDCAPTTHLPSACIWEWDTGSRPHTWGLLVQEGWETCRVNLNPWSPEPAIQPTHGSATMKAYYCFYSQWVVRSFYADYCSNCWLIPRMGCCHNKNLKFVELTW